MFSGKVYTADKNFTRPPVATEVSFLYGPKKLGFRPENPFLAIGPQILSMACFLPSARWFISNLQINCSTFCFRVTPVFVKKKAGQCAKKFSPTPLWVGAPSVSNSPSTLIGALDNKAGTSLARFHDPLAFGSGSGLQCVYTVVISL